MTKEHNNQQGQESVTQPAQNSEEEQSKDPRQAAIEQEQDTERIRSEQQSVKDGSQKK